MKKEEYFQRMEEVSTVVDKLLLDALEPLKDNPHLYNTVSELPLKRVGKSKVRAYFVRAVYELCNRDKPLESEWGPLATAVEMELCSMYYANQIYDCKEGKKSPEEIKKNVMATKITRDLAQKVLEPLREVTLGHANIERIIGLLNLSDMVVENGQYIDVFQNVYSVSGKLSFEEQVALYEERTHKIDARYFENIAEMSTELAMVSNPGVVNAVRNFGYHYGMLLQIVNDIADFVPPSLNQGTPEKLSEDAFSDVKHGKLTYPVIYTLNHGSKAEKNQLVRIIEKGEHANEEELADLTRMLVSNGSIDFATEKAKAHRNKAKKVLRIFSKDKRRPLSKMCVIAQTNKYYKALQSMRD